MRHTFKVRKREGMEQHTFTVDLPESPADTELVGKRYGTPARMTDRANAQWTVDVAPGIRKRLGAKGEMTPAAKEYAENFRDDGSKDKFVPSLSKDEVKEGAFTPEQLAILKAKGLKLA